MLHGGKTKIRPRRSMATRAPTSLQHRRHRPSRVTAPSRRTGFGRYALVVFWFFAVPLGLIVGIVLGLGLPQPSMLMHEIVLLGILSWSYAAYRVLGDLLEIAEVRGLPVRG